MSVTGLLLFGFVTAHLAGNLLVEQNYITGAKGRVFTERAVEAAELFPAASTARIV